MEFLQQYWQNKVFKNSEIIAEMLIFVAAQHKYTFPLCSVYLERLRHHRARGHNTQVRTWHVWKMTS